MVSLSDPQCQSVKARGMAIAPKVTGIISFACSAFIIRHVLRDRKRRSLVYHRLLMGMSTSDLFGAIVFILSTWPIPRGEACLAVGTTGTCTFQGFLNQVTALCTPTYNISLAIYYLLVIVKGWKESRIKKIEKYLHALPICLGFGTAFASLGLDILKPAGFICWIGNDYGIYRLFFMYNFAWAMIIILAISMTIIYFHVLKQEKKLDKYSASFAQKKRKQSKKIRNQAFLYVGCMYMTWIFGSIFRFMQFAGVSPPTYMALLFVTVFPLQGFFNLVVYMFPRIVRYFEQGVPLTQSFSKPKSSLFSTFRSAASRLSAASRMSTNSETPGKQSSHVGRQSSCVGDEGIEENGENGAAYEVEVDHGDEENREGQGLNKENTIVGDNKNGGGDSGDEGGEGEGEKDVLDELEYIVER